MSSNIERVFVDYKNCSQKFIETPSDYTRQYCSLYLNRLENMQELLVQRIQQQWGDAYTIVKIHKLTEENYDKCIVIGTLFKDQKLKPSVLKQLAKDNQLLPQPIVYTDESDVIYMEDEVQRYKIIGNIDGKKLLTGITCALLGSDIGKGTFQVEDCIFAGYRPQIARPILEEPVYILFLSGLNFIQQEKHLPQLQLLIYWLSGMFGDVERVSQVSRVIIAGNSIRRESPKAQSTISMISRVTESSDSIEAVKSFDQFLLLLCRMVDVDIMPGEHDPSNHILPQRPMHHCMFPKSYEYKSFNQVSNPYACEIGGFKLLGTSGQPIRDIIRYTEKTDCLTAMENCLVWNHLAPSAPDTLGCFPYYNDDPFIIRDCPHVFFTGNQEQFESKIVTGKQASSSNVNILLKKLCFRG
ncbi:hypothetical protein ABEB36_010113 [Hypothenemus hampei]|uniref:DNA polymerase delta small subunit n=1 Tax=Hypothenemus hampei TaxID=57062 RepID=A0ABD1EIL4_HYPHA